MYEFTTIIYLQELPVNKPIEFEQMQSHPHKYAVRMVLRAKAHLIRLDSSRVMLVR